MWRYFQDIQIFPPEAQHYLVLFYLFSLSVCDLQSTNVPKHMFPKPVITSHLHLRLSRSELFEAIHLIGLKIKGSRKQLICHRPSKEASKEQPGTSEPFKINQPLVQSHSARPPCHQWLCSWSKLEARERIFPECPGNHWSLNQLCIFGTKHDCLDKSSLPWECAH